MSVQQTCIFFQDMQERLHAEQCTAPTPRDNVCAEYNINQVPSTYPMPETLAAAFLQKYA